MKNPNTPINKLKAFMVARWEAADYPGGEPRFQIKAFGKDLGKSLLLPAVPFVIFHAFSEAANSPRRPQSRATATETTRIDSSKSQVIEFEAHHAGGGIGTKRAPGTLVRVRLLNVVEAYSATPVQARVMDAGLGPNFMGGILLGEGASDTTFDRLNINFKFARDPLHEGVAYSISARALSLNGTLGLEAEKKEGAFARGVYGAGVSGSSSAEKHVESMDLKSIVVKALTAGLAQEFGNGSGVEGNRAAVLTLRPGTEFFAELTDYFPSAGR